jgi:hypothetical protein
MRQGDAVGVDCIKQLLFFFDQAAKRLITGLS